MGTIKQNRANFITTAGKLDATGLNNDVPTSNITNASMTSVTAFPPSLGTGIKQVSSDPPSPSAGQIWFNTTSNVLKQYVLAAGSWASGGTANTARNNLFGVGESNSAALIYGGESPYKANTEQYDGSSWTEVNDLNTAKQNGASTGTTSAAVAVSGISGPSASLEVEDWDGTSWTETTEVNTGRQQAAGAGTQAAGLFFGGYTWPSPGIRNINESWNGSTWTEVGDLNTARYLQGGGGTNTAAICCGGDTPGVTANTETWNGSAWTEVSNLNTARKNLSEGAGLYDDFLTMGGNTGSITNIVEQWDGTSWTEVADLASNIQAGSSSGTTLSAIQAAGYNGSARVGTTQEWTQALATQTITTS